jgi:glutaminyl-peptide cyclotransferase
LTISKSDIRHLQCTLLIFAVIVFLSACNNGTKSKESTEPYTPADQPLPIEFKILNVFPHDTAAYTEGFLFHHGQLFESTGHTSSFPSSRSLFGAVDLKNGNIDARVEIDKNKYFGEGIVFLKGRIYQLTDTTRIGFIYDEKTYKKLGNFYYDGEGWGLTTNGSYILMSNGSSTIFYRDPSSFKVVKSLGVSDNNGPVQNLNELELIHGFLYANQWLTDYILKIDTTNGKVVGRLDLSRLKAEVKMKNPFSEETNGIAYDPDRDRIYVTGKRWPTIYEIRFDH